MQTISSHPRRARRRLLIASVLGALLLCTVVGQAFVTLDGDRTTWTNNPTYAILNALPGTSDGSDQEAVRSPFQSWEDVDESSLAFTEVEADADITVEFVSDWPGEFNASAAGTTLTIRQGGRILEAQIFINDDNFDWTTDINNDDPALNDIEGVMVHEIGHAIGLGHSYIADATMYWSGGDEGLRSLHPDDIRGVQFLYGTRGQGLLCDSCLVDSDCAEGGKCIGLEEGFAFCGVPCTGGCPDGTACFTLTNSDDTQCFPEAQFCSDRGGPGLEEGDYCWGANQCNAGLRCSPISGDEPSCLRECVNNNDCLNGTTCIGTEGGNGICLGGGDGAYGDLCDSNLSCESLLCVPLGDDVNVCTEECNTILNDCPGGGECADVGPPGGDGLCIPPGNRTRGESCDGAAQRCEPGLNCVPFDGDPICVSTCAPFGDCPDDSGCLPFGGNVWLCIEGGEGEIGESCNRNFDCGTGLVCAPSGFNANSCFEPCNPNRTDGCGLGVGCNDLELDGESVGICSPGEFELGEACNGDFDCRSFLCAFADDTTFCSLQCEGDRDCPEDWTCGATPNNGDVCFAPEPGPEPEGEPSGEPDGETEEPEGNTEEPEGEPSEPAPTSSGGGGDGCQTAPGRGEPLGVLLMVAMAWLWSRRRREEVAR